jgi:hypothetical protein
MFDAARVARRNRHRGALGRKRMCDCVAEALARTTDHGDLIGQAEIHWLTDVEGSEEVL